MSRIIISRFLSHPSTAFNTRFLAFLGHVLYLLVKLLSSNCPQRLATPTRHPRQQIPSSHPSPPLQQQGHLHHQEDSTQHHPQSFHHPPHPGNVPNPCSEPSSSSSFSTAAAAAALPSSSFPLLERVSDIDLFQVSSHASEPKIFTKLIPAYFPSVCLERPSSSPSGAGIPPPPRPLRPPLSAARLRSRISALMRSCWWTEC